MRACAACFWFRRTAPGEGHCYNRPPVVISMAVLPNIGHPHMETASVRPVVFDDDYCCHFSHPSKSRHQTNAPVTDVDGHTDPSPPGPTRG